MQILQCGHAVRTPRIIGELRRAVTNTPPEHSSIGAFPTMFCDEKRQFLVSKHGCYVYNQGFGKVPHCNSARAEMQQHLESQLSKIVLRE